MSSIRNRPETGQLFMDFKLNGVRMREQTALPDTVANRKRLQKVLDRIEGEIALGGFDYEKTFGKPLPTKTTDDEPVVGAGASALALLPTSKTNTPLFRDFANQWFMETEVSWRRSYVITQRGALDKYLLPHFGDKEVGSITKADALAFRASLAKVPARKHKPPFPTDASTP